jgi:hypothetical protein
MFPETAHRRVCRVDQRILNFKILEVYRLTVSAVFKEILWLLTCALLRVASSSDNCQFLLKYYSTHTAPCSLRSLTSRPVSTHPIYQCCVQCNSDLRIIILSISIFCTLCFFSSAQLRGLVCPFNGQTECGFCSCSISF